MKVLFFGRLRELLDCQELELTKSNAATVSQLRDELATRGAKWQEFIACDHALAAVNQMMALETDTIAAGDEVAFFPPVTGG